MATTTTNFGWDIPQSTDLVKDGATAIAALGQDIDTAFVDLKGGTTGQVLSKASNTDLDFSWGSSADNNDFDLLNTYTAPGSASTFSVNNIFSSTYTNYVIVGKMNNSSTNSLSIKLRVSGTDSSASYSSFIQYWGVNAGDGTTKVNNSTAGIYLENASTSNWISMEILNPFDAAPTGFIHSGIQQLGDGYGHFGSGFHNVSTSYDGFTLVTGGANISGTFSVYGLKK